MNSFDLTITVNKPDDTELEINAVCGPAIKNVGDAVEMALEVNGFKDGDWSSLVVVISNSDALPKRTRPTLALVR